ncbi:MAG: corrinoid protein-associated methyltransferase CpaM [Candidatus Hodarchaeales archaeon]
MSYVYMKVLEESPDEYETGISKLTAGMIEEIYKRILAHIKVGDEVLELGCGPGTFSILCAKKGAKIVAIDISEKMITFAKEKSREMDVSDSIQFILGDFTSFERFLPKQKFNVIVSTLALSELRHLEQQFVFNQSWNILTNEGIVAFADEVKPPTWGYKRFIYSVKRFFYSITTYWKTKKTTKAIIRFKERLIGAGFQVSESSHFLKDTLELVIGQRMKTQPPPAILSDQKMRGIRGIIRSGLCNLRAGSALIPIEPGLYMYGNTTKKSPVLVTANYQRTIRIVGSALQNQDVFLLALDTLGENVWCAARGDKFNSNVLLEAINSSRVEEFVDHRRLILPQLAAGGIDHSEIKKLSGWSVKFGPVYAKDIPIYLESGMKTRDQRKISFDLRERLEMAIQQSFFLSKFFFFWIFLVGLIGTIFLPQISLFSKAVLLLPMLWISYLIFGLIFPLFPTKSFFRRSILFGIMLAVISTTIGIFFDKTLIGTSQWTVISFALGHFLGMDYSGASPISKPSEIDDEYPNMIILLGICLGILLILAVVGLIAGL